MSQPFDPPSAAKEPLVIALGGNAILRRGERGSVREQLANIRKTCTHLLPILAEERGIVITHGNGPQIGNLLVSLEATQEEFPLLPLDACVAMTQGSLGYMIQRTLTNVLNEANVRRPVTTVITQVAVEPYDDAFWRPTKPIGPYYTAEEATYLQATKGWHLMEDAGRGHRRVVASPTPTEIVERRQIRDLLARGAVVIAGGGGGVPVIRSGDGALIGIEAVIDKDLASARLALDVGAETLLILTAVEHVAEGFGQPDARPIGTMSASEARRLLEGGAFPRGSMGPKIQAALDFLKGGGQEAIITLPEKAQEALAGRTGTHIVP